MNQLFSTKTNFQNHTVYQFDPEKRNITLDQTIPVTEKKYLAVTGDTGKINQLPCAFYLKNLHDVTLDFGGAIITMHGKIQPFIIDNCSNITIKNVTVEYDRSLYTELDIISRSGREIRAHAKEKFPCRAENGYFIPYSKTWENTSIHTDGTIFIQAFEKDTREGAGLAVVYLGEEIVEQETPPASDILHVRVRQEGEDFIFCGDFPEHWNENHTIVIGHEHRSLSSVAMFHSENIEIQNYRILNGGGMGFLALYTRNITLRKVRLAYDQLSHGIITNAADGIHFVSCKGKISISDSIFEGTIDDALNIHSNFYQVERTECNTVYAVRAKQSHIFPADSDIFGIGDEIAVLRGTSMEEHGRYRIIDRKISDRWHIALTLDRAGVFAPGDLIENLSTNAEIEIRSTRFGKANSHLRLQSRERVVVDQCRLSLPILLTGDADYWFESDPIRDLTITNCQFFGERANIRIIPEGFTPTLKAPYYHTGIKILNNCFESSIPLELHDRGDVLFVNNQIL